MDFLKALRPLFVGWMLFGVVLFFGRAMADPPSLGEVLKGSWEAYKAQFIQADGRVLDPKAEFITTSEGQSYALLRAVWMKDRSTFDTVYRWSVNNLQVREGDKLFAWKWGNREKGQWTVLDRASASDADEDIALALLMAYDVWGNPAYLEAARELLGDIWAHETLETPLGRVLLPGDKHSGHWQIGEHQVLINPSYFAPYAYRAFAEADKTHPWEQLADSSYDILQRAVAKSRTGLVPDWLILSLSRKDRNPVRLFYDVKDPRSDFGHDAIRTYWRISLDALVSGGKNRPAEAFLGYSNFVIRYDELYGRLPGPLTVDGLPRAPGGPPSRAVEGALLPLLAFQKREIADTLAQKILAEANAGIWPPRDDYYAQNWLWFGLALYNKTVPKSRTSTLKRLTSLLDDRPSERAP